MVVAPSNYLEQLQTHIAYANFLCVSDSLKLTCPISLEFHYLFSEYLQRQKNNEKNGISKLGGNQTVAA